MNEFHKRIYVAGHGGMVGSAIVRCLQSRGYVNILTRSHAELELTDQAQVRAFFAKERPEEVYWRPPRWAASMPTTPTRPSSSTPT